MFEKLMTRTILLSLTGLLTPLVACGTLTSDIASEQINTEEKAVMVFAGQPELELIDFNTQRSFQRFINRFHMLGNGLMKIQVKSEIEDDIPVSERVRKLRKFLTRSGLTDRNMIELPNQPANQAAAALTFSLKPPTDDDK